MLLIVHADGAGTPSPIATLGADLSASLLLVPSELARWLEGGEAARRADVSAVILCEPTRLGVGLDALRDKLDAPILAVSARKTAGDIVELLDAGFDDVVRAPVHLRELVARVDAIRRRRQEPTGEVAPLGDIVVARDGRDPLVGGAPFPLPRRERRILEFLVANEGRRVTRAQIFDAIYDVCDREAEEAVVESHVSKLRRKLRERLGYDPVESKRHCGYALIPQPASEAPRAA